MAGITRQILLDQTLPGPLATARVQVRRITIPPGVAAGAHFHNGPVFGSIEQGSVILQVEDGPQTVLNAGDVFYEPAEVQVTRFDATDAGAVFLAYFPLQAGQDPELRPVAGG
ncbi:MAG: cupin domain-containing protein [Solirubrobacterales bacterium]|nr:cupin domain-containing protein [Solirubrobacterales bacterium]